MQQKSQLLNETFVLFMWAVTISIHKIEMFTLRVLTFNIFAPRVETPQPTKDQVTNRGFFSSFFLPKTLFGIQITQDRSMIVLVYIILTAPMQEYVRQGCVKQACKDPTFAHSLFISATQTWQLAFFRPLSTCSLKFIYSEKAPKFCEIFPLILTVCTKSKGKTSQNFVAFSEYMNRYA